MTPLRIQDTWSSRTKIPIVSPQSNSGSSGLPRTDDVWQSPSCLMSVQTTSEPPSFNVHNVVDERFQWTRYLSQMTARGKLSRAVTEAALALWGFMQLHVPGIEVPHAGPTQDGGLLMVWDKGRHHFELEVSPSGRYDWFYRDRQTDNYWGAEDRTVGDYSQELKTFISQVWPEAQAETGAPKIEALIAAGA